MVVHVVGVRVGWLKKREQGNPQQLNRVADEPASV